MIRTILFVGAMLLIAFSAGAQDMKTMFVNMPDSLSPLFTKVNRADFSDFLESNMKALVKNKFDKMSEMKVLTKDYLFLEVTPQNTLEMKLLPLNDSVKVLCVIKTACAPACDSETRFFDTDWKELSADKFLKSPSVDDFFQVADITDMEKYAEVRGKADLSLMKAKLSPENNSITFIYTTPDYMDKESADELRKYLRENAAVVYTWENGVFKK